VYLAVTTLCMSWGNIMTIIIKAGILQFWLSYKITSCILNFLLWFKFVLWKRWFLWLDNNFWTTSVVRTPFFLQFACNKFFCLNNGISECVYALDINCSLIFVCFMWIYFQFMELPILVFWQQLLIGMSYNFTVCTVSIH
jgi:hypothetical protein